MQYFTQQPQRVAGIKRTREQQENDPLQKRRLNAEKQKKTPLDIRQKQQNHRLRAPRQTKTMQTMKKKKKKQNTGSKSPPRREITTPTKRLWDTALQRKHETGNAAGETEKTAYQEPHRQEIPR